MISLYEVFRIIFGLIISVFILAIILYFLGNYTQVQEDSQRALILKNFLKSSADVLITGNAVSFSDFSRQEFRLSFDAGPPAGIVSQLGRTPVFFPLFLRPGSRLFVSREELDMGWWKFSFVEAVPRLRVLFNPLDTTQENWDLIRSIVSLLPSSEFFEPKTTFGFCDGESLLENLCAGSLCEREDFLFELLSPGSSSFSACTASLPQDSVVIKISPSCGPSSGRVLCLSPPLPDGTGSLYIGGDGPFPYKDPLDIAAAAIGGGEENLFGNPGMELFEYKNTRFRDELLPASLMMANRSLLIAASYPKNSSCYPAHSAFAAQMTALSSTLQDEQYYNQSSSVASLVSQLKDAREAHEELVQKGCDY